MGLFDSSEDPNARARRYAISGVGFLLLLAFAVWYVFRFYPEKHAAERFLDAVATGNLEGAYQLWKPHSSYSYKDFLDDWGPTGYYGPVKSYHILSTTAPPKGGSGVIVVVEMSPFQPFPAETDADKHRRTKEVRIWVESKDKSLGFAP